MQYNIYTAYLSYYYYNVDVYVVPMLYNIYTTFVKFALLDSHTCRTDHK